MEDSPRISYHSAPIEEEKVKSYTLTEDFLMFENKNGMRTSYGGYSSISINKFLVIFGGLIHYGGFSNEIQLYSLEGNDCWVSKPRNNVPAARAFHTSCYYKNWEQIIFGGITTNNKVLNEIAILTLITTQCKSYFALYLNDKAPSYTWKVLKTKGGENLYRCYHTAHIYKDKMYVFGGLDKDNKSTNELWSLDLSNL